MEKSIDVKVIKTPETTGSNLAYSVLVLSFNPDDGFFVDYLAPGLTGEEAATLAKNIAEEKGIQFDDYI